MQLMPQTAERFGVLDPFDPRQNITGGTKYLRWLLDHFHGDLTKTVAAYNAGEGAVEKYLGIPPFAETRAYVPRVLDLYTKRLVQADPKASGAMALLKKGHGGFLVDQKPVPTADSPRAEGGRRADDAPARAGQGDSAPVQAHLPVGRRRGARADQRPAPPARRQAHPGLRQHRRVIQAFRDAMKTLRASWA